MIDATVEMEELMRLEQSLLEWDGVMKTMAEELARISEEYFKPMLSVKPDHTGDTEKSIRHEISHTANGFDISWYGLKSANWMDEGNFPSGVAIFAEEYGLKAFPIGKRTGKTVEFSKKIRGMGSRTDGVPTHWAQKTVDWLAEEKALEIAYEMLINTVLRG